MGTFQIEERKRLQQERTGMEVLHKNGQIMKVIEYNLYSDVLIEFQDKFKKRIRTTWGNIQRSYIKNPYAPTVYGVGIIGDKYPTKGKEYKTWQKIVERCVNKKTKERCPSYENVTISDEWLLYENFYEWLHSQENFEKWLNGKDWAVDKDILIKGNKVYSSATCCLVPRQVNNLFIKRDADRGAYPIGVYFDNKQNIFVAQCSCVEHKNHRIFLGHYYTPEDAFDAYKKCKENIIKRVAKEEYEKRNITQQCYEAMVKYEVEITD